MRKKRIMLFTLPLIALGAIGIFASQAISEVSNMRDNFTLVDVEGSLENLDETIDGAILIGPDTWREIEISKDGLSKSEKKYYDSSLLKSKEEIDKNKAFNRKLLTRSSVDGKTIGEVNKDSITIYRSIEGKVIENKIPLNEEFKNKIKNLNSVNINIFTYENNYYGMLSFYVDENYQEAIVSLDLNKNSVKVEKVLESGKNLFFNLYDMTGDYLYFMTHGEKEENYKKLNVKTGDMKEITDFDKEGDSYSEFFHSGNKLTYAIKNQSNDSLGSRVTFKTLDFDKEEVKSIDYGMINTSHPLSDPIICQDNKIYYNYYDDKDGEILAIIDIEEGKTIYKGKISRNLTIKNIKK